MCLLLFCVLAKCKISVGKMYKRRILLIFLTIVFGHLASFIDHMRSTFSNSENKISYKFHLGVWNFVTFKWTGWHYLIWVVFGFASEKALIRIKAMEDGECLLFKNHNSFLNSIIHTLIIILNDEIIFFLSY